MTDDEKERSRTVQVLAWRMTLAALRCDETAFNAAWADLQAVREADLQAHGQSNLIADVMRTLAANAAGACLDSEEAYGGNRPRAECFIENQIRDLLDEASL